MPQPAQLAKAQLQEIAWDESQTVQEVGEAISVQFNPQSLRVNFSNQTAGGGQSGGSAIQYVGKGKTTLSLELWFDVTAPRPERLPDPRGDVRRLTDLVAQLMQPTEQAEENQYVPPGVRFIWGTFLFEGVMESLDETLEYFSEDGKPLRASVAIRMCRQEILVRPEDGSSSGSATHGTAGTRPRQPARAGDTVQRMAARSGRTQDWRAIAAANNIENPRHLTPGTLLEIRVPR